MLSTPRPTVNGLRYGLPGRFALVILFLTEDVIYSALSPAPAGALARGDGAKMGPESFHAFNVILHIAAGVAALIVGLIPMAAAKGGATHVWSGRVFASLGVFVFATAIIGVSLFDPPGPLVAATFAGGYQFVSSIRALQLKRHGPQTIDALLAIACLIAIAALLFTMGEGTRSWTPAIGYSTLGFLALIAVYDLSRHAWSSAWLTHARIYDHGVKMTGAYFAMLSAGVGNVFRDYQPWSQVGPSALGIIVILALVWSYARRRSST